MILKTRILLILIAASILSAILAGVALVAVVQSHSQITLDGREGPVLTGLAIAVYWVSGLLVLAVLGLLLKKIVLTIAAERDALENERAMLSEQLRHSQRIGAVGRLVGHIAHDFNNLLTIIDGYSSLIISDPGSAYIPQNAQEVLNAARKASLITRKLLSFSQKEPAVPVLLDLRTALQDSDKIQLMASPVAEPIFVMADPVQLGQILMNLAVNARDAMPDGGRITITSSSKDVKHGEARKPDVLPEGTYACISMRDTGQGMAEDTLEHIFEPFFTTKDSDKGIGLGLSIVNDIVERNRSAPPRTWRMKSRGSTWSPMLLWQRARRPCCWWRMTP